MDYEYSYDVASMLKDSYYYEQSQSIPFKYHCEEETIPEADANKKRNGKYIWFEPATLVMNTCNGFLYAWYDVEKDINGSPVVTEGKAPWKHTRSDTCTRRLTSTRSIPDCQNVSTTQKNLTMTGSWKW